MAAIIISNSDHRNPGNVYFLNPQSKALESGIQLTSGIRTLLKVESTNDESRTSNPRAFTIQQNRPTGLVMECVCFVKLRELLMTKLVIIAEKS